MTTALPPVIVVAFLTGDGAAALISSSTLPERNYMISLETGSKTQTTKRV
jgi:hypothetical protein